MFQAVCKDKIFPKIHVFATGYGASDNPRRAYLLAYFIGIGFICIGEPFNTCITVNSIHKFIYFIECKLVEVLLFFLLIILIVD